MENEGALSFIAMGGFPEDFQGLGKQLRVPGCPRFYYIVWFSLGFPRLLRKLMVPRFLLKWLVVLRTSKDWGAEGALSVLKILCFPSDFLGLGET